jgi:transposase
MVARMDELFALDTVARAGGFSLGKWHELRREQALPLLAEMERELRALQLAALPASALGKAVNYSLSLWGKLNRFLEYPELELSNNQAENSMRGLAVGRKNWVHVGSEKAGPKVAAILPVMESCRRLGDISIQRVAERTPLAWKMAKEGA